jgi:hypothetical protein
LIKSSFNLFWTDLVIVADDNNNPNDPIHNKQQQQKPTLEVQPNVEHGLDARFNDQLQRRMDMMKKAVRDFEFSSNLLHC